MEKPRLINFIAKVMENSGFKVYKNFKTSQYTIDIYAVLPTTFGDFGVVVECNNYDKDFPVSIETLKHMEKVGLAIKASKVVVVTSSYFTEQANNYAIKKNIKLVDRTDLLGLAKKYQDNNFRLDREDFHDMGYYGDIVPIDAGIETSNDYEDDYDYDDYVSYEGGYDDYVYVDHDYDYDYDYDMSYDASYDDYDYGYDYDVYPSSSSRSDPVIYQNSLYRREFEKSSGPGFLSYLKEQIDHFLGVPNRNRNVYTNSGSSATHSLYRQTPGLPPAGNSFVSTSATKSQNIQGSDIVESIVPHLGNPVVLIVLVVLFTYLLSFIGGSLLRMDSVVVSSLQIAFALILSYGFSYFFGDRTQAFFIRGTVVFFISLIILVLLIVL